jgi:potassium/hydrogen antiporter
VTRDVIATLAYVLGAGLAVRTIASVIPVPEMLLLVIVGALLGPSVTGAIDVPLDSLGAQLIFTLGVSAILFYGGLNLSVAVLRRTAISLGLLATVGLLVTAGIVAVAARFAFGLDWTESLLLGAVLSPTDPAILIPLFTGTRLRPKVAQTLIAESAFNDPVGAVLALSLAGVLLSGDSSVGRPAVEFLIDLGISTGVGIVAGVALSAAISSHRAGIWRESSAIAVLAVVTIGYVSLDSAGGSGYLGAFVAGLIVGNMERLGLSMHPEHEREMNDFARNFADIVTLLVFVVLGANLPFAEIWSQLGPALVVLAALILVARPLVVRLCTLGDRRAGWTVQELTFLACSRETGVVPAALVGVLAGLGVPDNALFASVIGLAVVVTLALQAMPAPWLARRLGLLEPEPPDSAGSAAGLA